MEAILIAGFSVLVSLINIGFILWFLRWRDTFTRNTYKSYEALSNRVTSLEKK